MAAAALFCAAAFAPGLTAYAQNLDEGTYEEKNGIAYRKSATLVNGTTDEYWIELEAFVTGEVKVVKEVAPADIVLVLDVSGSMEQPVTGTYIQESSFNYFYVNAKKNPHFADDHADNKNYLYFYKDGDNYYQLNCYTAENYESNSASRKTARYFIRFQRGGSYYYLGPDGAVQIASLASGGVWTDAAKRNSKTGTQTRLTSWFPNDNVYRYQSRLEVLQAATKQFARSVAYYSTHDPDGQTMDPVDHKVAIVPFSDDVKTPYPFSSVSDSDIDEIDTFVQNLPVGGYTNTDLGVSRAVSIIAENGRADANKFIVVFTDGYPGGSSSFDSGVANRAIGAVSAFKDPAGTVKGVVYSIGMLDNPPTQARDFLNYMSSNYPKAQNLDTPGAPASEQSHYQLASGADLTEIFESIAEHAAGTSANTQVTAESAVTVDVVTTSFNIPKTAGGTYDIQVLVAACNGQSDRINPKTGKNYLTFDAPVSPEAAGFEITLDPDALDNNEVVTHGFDYSANFCAYNAEADPPARGYKQIIRFRIKANEDAVGGPDVTTNDQSSGIWIDDPDNPGQKKQIAEFNRPTVKVPVQIWIAKDGLVGDDNAIFTLYWAQPEDRHYVPDPNNPERMVIDPTKFVKAEWHQFTKVTLNNNLQLKYNYNGKQIPLVKIPGLDPDYVYQIKEDAWSWSYEPVVRIMYTAGEEIHNPFVFVNQPRENLKEAESGIRNVFNEGTVTPDPNAPVAP